VTAVILQSRLDSTRLPRKALLDLGGKPLLARVMENLRRVDADERILACDPDSAEAFRPLAESEGFRCVVGPKDDVLERFCVAIRSVGATTVLRATGDNPYLFADAAEASLRRFEEINSGAGPGADYFTFSGLPHGSGVEVFSAARLLEAAALTDSAYDREHVGPALYKHPDRFVSVFETAPSPWNAPHARTTVDTRADYERARRIFGFLMRNGLAFPAASPDVLRAWEYASRPVLFVPAATEGVGTGHVSRVTSLARELSADRHCAVYLPGEASRFHERFAGSSVEIVDELPENASLVVLDGFRTSVSDMDRLRRIGPVVALDEGGEGRALADFLLDVIPRVSSRGTVANETDPSYLPLPIARRKTPAPKIRRALAIAGGDNAGGLAYPAARALLALGLSVTVLDPGAKGVSRADDGITVWGTRENLRESLSEFDLVLTHYGFTAFEALAAGCNVLLFSPTLYHYALARSAGFSALPFGKLSPKNVRRALSRDLRAPPVVTPLSVQKSLKDRIDQLSRAERVRCPLCGADSPIVSFRSDDRSVAECSECGMRYLAFRVNPISAYGPSYFFEEYRAQYGKTYLEDFESIKKQGARRIATIDRVFSSAHRDHGRSEKNVLDVGCAYGPFLSAARDAGWSPYGTDLSPDAAAYVADELKIPSCAGSFPENLSEGFAGRKYDAITFWYVIEHFRDLSSALSKARSMLSDGGVLALATPSCAGVSGLFSPKSFYRASPVDHYTIWDPRSVRAQLARYGFTVARVVSTGHHPERLPMLVGRRIPRPARSLLMALSRAFRLGDTFEIYAVKNGEGDIVL